MSSLNRRRSLVLAVTLASIAAAALTIQLAASWTVAAAPLAERPPDPAELVADLAQERARADALADELEQVVAQADEVRDALAAAQEKAGRDAATAADLGDQLATAQARLATLRAQLAVAAVPPVTLTVTEPAAATQGGDHDEEDEDHEEEEDGD